MNKTNVIYENKTYSVAYHLDLIHNIATATGTFFEEWLLTPLKNKVTSFEFVVDIGANVGNHAFFFKNICNSKRVICFEPLEQNLVLLKENCPNCEIYPYALSDEEKKGFISNININGNSGVAQISSDGTPIELKTLDSFNFKNVTFIKIDVEGYELKVLKGALKTILTSKPDIMVETHIGITPENVLELLPGYSYEHISHEPHYLFKYKC
jgi:FkbM family methyltransferase